MEESRKQLSADDLAYHKKVNAAFEQARAIFAHWSAHLVQKYQLGEQDQIHEDGTIERGPTEETP